MTRKKKQKTMKEQGKTMIPLLIKTRTRLKRHKIVKGESYDGVINRSLDSSDELNEVKKRG